MDDVDFTALVTRASAGLDGLRACLLLSGDGFTLGVYPPAGEERAREAWDRLEQLGNPRRGFVDVGEELWAVLRTGPYTGVLVTGPGAKPGLLLDRLEVLLRTAEEARTRDAADAAATPPRPEATRRPRTPLHAEPKPDPAPRTLSKKVAAPKPAEPKAPAKAAAAEPPTAIAPRYAAPDVLRGAAKRVVDITLAAAEQEEEPEATSTKQAAPAGPPPTPQADSPRPTSPRVPDEDAEVDRVALAREFGALLAEREGSG